MNPIQRVIKRHRVRTDPEANDLPDSRKDPRSTSRTKARGARLVHVDGRLQAIEVTCSCGEVMVIEIEYERVSEEAVS